MKTKKAFFITFKGISLKQIKTTFLEDESPALNLIIKRYYAKYVT